ncbi:MAG TPA: sigma-70 family RNA polymerase sigma factor [Anaerolineae bacterium]|nr:sigma-70 family RNA polymerase sigma factor [Anaerolineae bacterium]
MTQIPLQPMTELPQLCKQRVKVSAAPARLRSTQLSETGLARQVAQIVQHNLASGRAHRVIGCGSGVACLTQGQIEQYIDRVIACYLDEYPRVKQLAEGDSCTWLWLVDLLARRAYHMLQRWQVSSLQANQEAADFAQLACESISQALFPYDVAFSAWATLILKNHVRKRYTRSPDLIDRNPFTESLDAIHSLQPENNQSLYDMLADPLSEALFKQVDDQEQLTQAIACLSSHTQRDVITFSYLHGLSDELIARRLGKSKQAVYNLRHRALRQLRNILGAAPKDAGASPH